MRKKILEILFVFSFLVLVLPLCGEADNSELSLPFAVIPQPQKVELLKEEGWENSQFKNLVFNGNKRQPMGVDIEKTPGSFWYTGVINHGYLMPIQNNYKANMYANNYGNQIQPLILSNKGDVIWSEDPIDIVITDDSIMVKSSGPVKYNQSGKNLRDAFLFASKNYFPSKGKKPDTLLFTKPQYNTWIELVYNQNQVDIINYANGILENGFPSGVLMIDDNWQEDYGKWNFHPGRFKDAKQMISELHKKGFKVMLWICPFVSPDCDVFRKLESQGLFLKDHSGSTKMVRWWNGVSALLDFTNPEAVSWFKSQLNYLTGNYGVDGFKFDAGDAEYYVDVVAQNDVSPNVHSELFARIGLDYPLNEYRAMWKMGGQPIVNRLRDKEHNWKDLQTLIPNMIVEGLMGYIFSCPDLIGGGEYSSFLNAKKIDQDLIVRSAQCHALMPMMQFSVAPWRVLDELHLNAVKKAVEIRQKYIHYLMSVVEQSSISGEPILRAMEYVFPNSGYIDVKDQFLIGDKLLVAPVLTKDVTTRRIIIPEGKWKSFEGQVIQGPTTIDLPVKLETLPLFMNVE